MHFAIIHANFKAFVIKLEEYLTKKQPPTEMERENELGKDEQILAPM